MGKKETYINAVISRHMGSNMLNTGDLLNYKSDGINKRTNEELERVLRDEKEIPWIYFGFGETKDIIHILLEKFGINTFYEILIEILGP